MVNPSRKPIEAIAVGSSFAGMLSLGLTIAQNLALVPLFLQYWGRDTYGIWISILSFTGLLHSVTVGYQSFMGMEFNKAYHRNTTEARIVLGSAFRGAFLFGLLELGIFLALYGSGSLFGLLGVEPSEQRRGEVFGGLAVLMICWVSCQAMGGLLVRVILALGEYARNVYFGIALQLATILVLLLATTLRLSIFTTCLILAVVSAVYVAVVLKYVAGRMPEFYPWWAHGSLRGGLRSFRRSAILSGSVLLEQFSTNGVTLLVAASTSAVTVPLWATTRTLSNLGAQFAVLLTNPMVPEMARLHATREGDKLSQVIQTSWLVVGVVIAVGFIVVSPWIPGFYALWTRNELALDPVVFVLLSLSVGLMAFSRPYFTYLSGINSVNALLAVSATKGFVLIASSVVLVQWWGLAGVALAVALGELSSCVVLRAIARQSLRADGSYPSIGFEFAAFLMMAVMGVSVAAGLHWPGSRIPVVVVSLAMIAAIGRVQWRMLDADVRERVSVALENVVTLESLRTKLFSRQR